MTQPAGYLAGMDSIGTVSGTSDGKLASSTAGSITNVVLGQANAGVGYNFGELLPTAVSGFVYADTNNNGVDETGETGIAGVSLNYIGITDIGGVITGTTTTNSTGAYSFNNLRPGAYTVFISQPTGYLPGLPSINGSVIGGAQMEGFIGGISPRAGAPAANNNFGELLPSTLSGFVYSDPNDNGVKDSGETGIAGATVTLTGSNDLGTMSPLTVTSGSDGSYSFGNLRPGTYSVAVTQPAGFLAGTDSIGTVGGTSDGKLASSTAGVFTNVVLGQANAGVSYNFGELQPTSITGFVYVDANNDGTMETGETPLAGVTLSYTGVTDIGGIVSGSATTNSAGAYTFGNLRPGAYTVSITQPTGYFAGLAAIGGLPIAGSQTNPVIGGVSPQAGAPATNNNFGELAPASVSGFVFVDSNDNGTKDTGEVVIAGATVSLAGTNDLGASVSVTLTTGSDGSFSFGNLRPGTYSLTESVPSSLQTGLDAVGTVNGVIDGTVPTPFGGVVSNIVINSGNAGIGYSFGALQVDSINGAVYVDANNSGIKDAGETAVGGVTLTLTGTSDIGAITPVTVTTASDGSYSFGKLRPGTYAITETAPAGYLQGLSSSNGVVNAGSNTTNMISGISLLASGTSSTDNFGELLPNTVSGFVYTDSNNDGTLETGETGISGVSLVLSGTSDLGTLTTHTTTTPADRSYSFGNLRPGTYQVSEIPPAGYLPGLESSQGAVIAGSVGLDLISGLTVVSGASSASNNFGELPPASISGVMFIDSNDDGIKEAGEAPMVGVTLTLTGANDLGTISPLTVTTAQDGTYSFGNLRPGTYNVSASVTGGTLNGLVSRNGVVIANSYTGSTITGIVVPVGGNSSADNLGQLNPATVSGSIYYDANDNGLLETGESGIAGVTVTLTGTDDTGTITPITLTSAADGSYSFGNLRPGTYNVTETLLPGYLEGLKATNQVVIPNSGTTNTISGIALGSGNGAAGNNFGDLLPGTVSGSVYVDLNNNGFQDSGENGIAGVTVTVSGTNDLGQSVSASATTSASGTYTFSGLRPGTYAVTETHPSAYIAGLDSTNGVLVPTTNPHNIIGQIAVFSGLTSAANEFGELLPISLAGVVYDDKDGSGTLSAGDAGIANVTLTLTDTTNSRVVAITTTGSNGTYDFAVDQNGNLLPAGSYAITEQQPAGFLQGSNTVGSVIGSSDGQNLPIDEIQLIYLVRRERRRRLRLWRGDARHVRGQSVLRRESRFRQGGRRTRSRRRGCHAQRHQ